MSRGIGRNEIPKCVLAGMARGATTWDQLYGTWASKAPEYWLTVNVAQRLQKDLDTERNWIALESSVKETMRLAGVVHKGRPKSSLRRDGRCDIVVTHLNEKPFAAIEIKTRAYAYYGSIKKDVSRLCEMLRKDKANSLTIACLALYLDASDDSRAGADGHLKARFNANLQAVRAQCSSHSLRVNEIHKIRRRDQDTKDCWGVQCLYLVRK